MSLKSLRLLNTFCWHSFGAWGDRMLLINFCFSEFSTAENVWNTPPIPFSLDAEVWAPATLFSFPFVVLPEAACREALESLFPSPWLSQLTPMLIPTVSTAKCDAFNFFGFCIVFAFLFWVFPFLLRLCPEKQVVHVPCCFFTPSYVSPSPLCFL